MGGITTQPTAFGLVATEEDLRGYVFFWKCCGYQLGLNDDYNLCGRNRPVINTLIPYIWCVWGSFFLVGSLFYFINDFMLTTKSTNPDVFSVLMDPPRVHFEGHN